MKYSLVIFCLFIGTTLALNYNPNIKNNNNCTLCISLVNDIIVYEQKFNASVVKLIDFIKSICSHVYGPSAKECTFVLNRIDYILQLIGKGLDATKICQMIHVCKNYLYI